MNTLSIEVSSEKRWWNHLGNPWKKAFGEACFGHLNPPSDDEISALLKSAVLRFAGPSAQYPNMSFELSELSGLSAFSNLEMLVIIHHRIQILEPLSQLKKLKSLFVFNNKISSLKGLEELTELEQLYAQCNKISSIREVENLLRLRELYVCYNELESLEGLTEAHSDSLEGFFCKPNRLLKQREILRVERELGICCRTS